jgi:hypothetical protein
MIIDEIVRSGQNEEIIFLGPIGGNFFQFTGDGWDLTGQVAVDFL